MTMYFESWQGWQEYIAAAEAQARNAGLEEAAKVADRFRREYYSYDAEAIADDIRALKDHGNSGSYDAKSADGEISKPIADEST